MALVGYEDEREKIVGKMGAIRELLDGTGATLKEGFGGTGSEQTEAERSRPEHVLVMRPGKDGRN